MVVPVFTFDPESCKPSNFEVLDDGSKIRKTQANYHLITFCEELPPCGVVEFGVKLIGNSHNFCVGITDVDEDLKNNNLSDFTSHQSWQGFYYYSNSARIYIRSSRL